MSGPLRRRQGTRPPAGAGRPAGGVAISDEDLARGIAVGRHLPRIRLLLAALLSGDAEDMAATAAAEDPVDPVDGLERGERRARVREALATLSVDERMLVVMKDVEELGIAEIAATTGLPEGTVKSRLHRAREKLARRLDEGAAV